MSGHCLPSRKELYSRSKGIIEVDILQDKRIAIIGLGSFGSHIAIEMAKAGVGELHLFDFDRVELHNLVRHTATVHDLGKLKTDVIEESVLGKNPYARVFKYPIDINKRTDTLTDVAAKCDLLICATDNNHSRFLLSQISSELNIPCIYGRANTRTEGGDVFIQRGGDACYCCLIGNEWFDADDEEITDEASARREGKILAYASAAEAGILHKMTRKCPNAKFYPVLPEVSEGSLGCSCNECQYMKMNSLLKIYNCLKYSWPAVEVDPQIAREAVKPIGRMLEMS